MGTHSKCTIETRPREGYARTTMARPFSEIRTWVFDLDNTLYPPAARLFDQIEKRMTAYVMDALNIGETEANALRRDYWHQYGTTLAGLMDLHGVDPLPYLTTVHEIDLGALQPDPDLRRLIAALPGRRIVYTNGSGTYAERVIAARGLTGVFDAIYGVEHADFRPKPERAAFEAVFARDQVDPGVAAMFEDDVRNLEVPHQMGMRTVHVAPDPTGHDHVHHHTDDLAGFLAKMTVSDG